MKCKPRRQGKQLSAVFKNSWANSPDFGFFRTLISTLPTSFNAKVLSAQNFLLKAFKLSGFPSQSYVSKLMSEKLLPLSNIPVINFLFNDNSTLKHFVLIVEHTLITLIFPSFYSNGKFVSSG